MLILINISNCASSFARLACNISPRFTTRAPGMGLASLPRPSKSMIGMPELETLPEFSTSLCCSWMNIRGILSNPTSTSPLTPALESSKAFNSVFLSYFDSSSA
ncbi:hypothetical protein CFP56_019284 [Quercus suber]|uniref:Uncharacterized protein n=1 Tax=Quercus suber TaxID=58331 RepID=A0AAW0KJ45_QUESU